MDPQDTSGERDPRRTPHHTRPDERRKMRALILYIAKRCADDPHFGSTKLNKILVHADFSAFAERGESITHYVYQANREGPTLRALLPVLRDMVSEGLITVEYREMVYQQERVVPLRDPDPDVLSDEERAIADRSINYLAELTATEASELSHEFPGWRHAWEHHGKGATIPYEAVFWSKRRTLSPREQEHARELGERYDLTG
jgi:hypothetical protein